MWVHILNDATIARRIEAAFVPLRVDATAGFPPLPGLDRFAREFDENPWHRFFYAHFLATDPTGTMLLGGTGCQIRDLNDESDTPLDAFMKWLATIERRQARLTHARRRSDRDELTSLRTEIRRAIDGAYSCMHDRRVVTMRALLHLGNDLPALLDPASADSKRGVPADVRGDAIEALGALLTDTRPFAPCVRDHLEVLAMQMEPADRDAMRMDLCRGGYDAVRVPPGLARRAATMLGIALGQSRESAARASVADAVAAWRDARRAKGSRR